MLFSALEKIQATSEMTNMNNFRIEDELFTGIFRYKAGVDKIGIYPDIVQAMLKEKPHLGAKDYQVGLKIANCSTLCRISYVLVMILKPVKGQNAPTKRTPSQYHLASF